MLRAKIVNFLSFLVFLWVLSVIDSAEVSVLDENVVRKWSNITVDVRARRILSMGQGALFKTRLVGMLGPSGR